MAGEIDVDALVSHHMPLQDVNRAFELMHAQDGIRTVLDLA
jgi:S-(hydroxymethyl)glutathione dehydrogenase/alcohol dehydrogenase